MAACRRGNPGDEKRETTISRFFDAGNFLNYKTPGMQSQTILSFANIKLKGIIQ
jgi:hypothetical protein